MHILSKLINMEMKYGTKKIMKTKILGKYLSVLQCIYVHTCIIDVFVLALQKTLLMTIITKKGATASLVLVSR